GRPRWDDAARGGTADGAPRGSPEPPGAGGGRRSRWARAAGGGWAAAVAGGDDRDPAHRDTVIRRAPRGSSWGISGGVAREGLRGRPACHHRIPFRRGPDGAAADPRGGADSTAGGYDRGVQHSGGPGRPTSHGHPPHRIRQYQRSRWTRTRGESRPAG